MNMQKKMDVTSWLDYWESSKRFPNKKSEREHADSWNERWRRSANGMAKHMTAAKKRKRMDEIFAMLDEAGFKVKGARILDVGCGPGAISIPFAKAGAKVTSLDISKIALERLQTDAEKEGLSIETIEQSWWTANIDKLKLRNGFDLVFVTSTPAVKDAAGFDRMNACSRNYCYYSHSIRSGGHMHIDHHELFDKIPIKEPSRHISSEMSWFMYGFMYLYLNGHRPLIRINHHQMNMDLEWEEAANQAIRSLEFTGACTAATKRKIREYYQKTAVNGKCHTRAEGCSGMMVWNVKN